MTAAQLQELGVEKFGDRVALMSHANTYKQQSFQATQSKEIIDKITATLSTTRQRKRNWTILKGNTNAKKSKRRVELGWVNIEGDNPPKQVRQNNGGGTRSISVDMDSTAEHLVEVGKSLFFPGGKSLKGDMRNFTFSIVTFDKSPVDATSTLSELYAATGFKLLRLYLCTKPTVKNSPTDKRIRINPSLEYVELPVMSAQGTFFATSSSITTSAATSSDSLVFASNSLGIPTVTYSSAAATTSLSSLDEGQSSGVASSSTPAAGQSSDVGSFSTLAAGQSSGVASFSTSAAGQTIGVASSSTPAAGHSSDVVSFSTLAAGQSSDVASFSTSDVGQSSGVASASTPTAGHSSDVVSFSTPAAGQSSDVVSFSTLAAGQSSGVASFSTSTAGQTIGVASSSTPTAGHSSDVSFSTPAAGQSSDVASFSNSTVCQSSAVATRSFGGSPSVSAIHSASTSAFVTSTPITSDVLRFSSSTSSPADGSVMPSYEQVDDGSSTLFLNNRTDAPLALSDEDFSDLMLFNTTTATSDSEIGLGSRDMFTSSLSNSEKDVLSITVHRGHVLQELEDYFMQHDSDCVSGMIVNVSMVMPNGIIETAEDTGGVFRDMLSEYWESFYNTRCEGADLKVPVLSPSIDARRWRAVGSIIAMGYHVERYLPVRLAPSFLQYSLDGKADLDKGMLIEQYLRYLPDVDRKSISTALDDFEAAELEELIEFYESHGCRSMPSAKNVQTVIGEIAHKELIQSPSFIAEAMRARLQNLIGCIKEPLTDLSYLVPTFKKVWNSIRFDDVSTAIQQML
jgi:hypothetical protein